MKLFALADENMRIIFVNLTLMSSSDCVIFSSVTKDTVRLCDFDSNSCRL